MNPPKQEADASKRLKEILTKLQAALLAGWIRVSTLARQAWRLINIVARAPIVLGIGALALAIVPLAFWFGNTPPNMIVTVHGDNLLANEYGSESGDSQSRTQENPKTPILLFLRKGGTGSDDRFENVTISLFLDDPDGDLGQLVVDWTLEDEAQNKTKLNCVSHCVFQPRSPGKYWIHIDVHDLGNALGFRIGHKQDTIFFSAKEADVPVARLPASSFITVAGDPIELSAESSSWFSKGWAREPAPTITWTIFKENSIVQRVGGERRRKFTLVDPGEYVAELVITDLVGQTSKPATARVSVLQRGATPTTSAQVIPAGQVLREYDFANQTVELSGEYLTNGQPLTIKAAKIVANNAVIRSFRSGSSSSVGIGGTPGRHGDSGPSGSGAAGGGGGDGESGQQGADGKAAAPVRLLAKIFTGNLAIDNSGENGGRGGDGGVGGNGGDGGSGGDGASGVFDCRRGPGSGGNGGRAGSGGAAGSGGHGGDAGSISVVIEEKGDSDLITIAAKGGAGGEIGSRGSAGQPGRGGPRGSAPGLCSAGGAEAGSGGASGNAGSEGQMGANGADGQIAVRLSGGSQQVSTGVWPVAP